MMTTTHSGYILKSEYNYVFIVCQVFLAIINHNNVSTLNLYNLYKHHHDRLVGFQNSPIEEELSRIITLEMELYYQSSSQDFS